MKNQKLKLLVISAMLIGSPFINAHAATPVDLSKQNPAKLNGLLSASASKNFQYEETRRNLGLKNKLHVRVQQTYSGYPVWGADAVVHMDQGSKFKTASFKNNSLMANASSMNGTMYQGLQQDLAQTPETVFSSAQAQKAIDEAVKQYQEKTQMKTETANPQSKLMVYVDDNNKAHWSFLVSFNAPDVRKNRAPVTATYIMDAESFHVYKYWNDTKTSDAAPSKPLENVTTGGFGGNAKSGQVVYDGLENHLTALSAMRDAQSQTCYLKNAEITVKTCTSFSEYSGCTRSKEFQSTCKRTDIAHNNIYWNGEEDAINGAYSPSNDAMFNANIVKKLYTDWTGQPVLTKKDNSPMELVMIVHLKKLENAYWDGKTMNFGDGDTMFYPLTSLGITAHEISHGFTEQHSNLNYEGQSGGMNEAFSDMAAKAAEYYVYGKDLHWELAPEVFKKEGEALRYMDKPSKDCKEDESYPGDNCSIDTADQYNNRLDVHYSSGVYNRFFYTLSTTQGWDTKKAFLLMVQANANYWTKTTNFTQGACGVLKAADDLGYEKDAIKKAFDVVKVNTSDC